MNFLFRAILCIFLFSGCITVKATNLDDGLPQGFPLIPSESRQVIVIEPNGFDPKKANVTLWERQGSLWVMESNAIPASVGRNGIASFGSKKEGDGKTPSGTFYLKTAFGYADRMSTGLKYRQATVNDFWVDDVKSSQYNRWVVGHPQADSFELLRRDDDLYEYAFVIEYNTQPVVPGAGSAIFFHVWRGPGQPTSGCVAVSKKDILKILDWLDLSKTPTILIKP